MAVRIRTILLGMAACLCHTFPSLSQIQSSSKGFGVQDSIEMRVFSDPYTRHQNATAKGSPDGKGFVIVTTQGHLASNTLESCLWYFRTTDLQELLDQKEALPPPPRLLFRKQGIPEAEQIGSYGSLITDVQWSSNSQALTFLVEGAHGVHHLYQIGLSKGSATDLTPDETGDVISPVLRHGTAVYLVSPTTGEKRNDGHVVSTVLTGHSIFETLFPQEFPDPPGLGKAWKLRARFHGKTRTFPAGKDEFFPYTAAQAFNPSISPDGSFVLTVVPVQEVPPMWSAYRTANPIARFTPSDPSSDHSGRRYDWPWQYALINLRTGTLKPLVVAPTPYLTFWGGPFEAKWSSSGDRVLITQTYISLNPAQQYEANSVSPCAIAEYSTKDGVTTCLIASPLPNEGKSLLSVDYDVNDHVVALWSTRGKQTRSSYDNRLRRWVAIDTPAASSNAIELFIHQDIDVPPTIWLRKGNVEKLLWNPNPQLNTFQLAKARAYQWTDPSGYTWRGGLVLPTTPAPTDGYPLVIQTHGFFNEHEFLVDGAFTSGYAAQPLASAGIAVLQMEDRAGRHSRPPEGEAEDEIRGVESAIDHLAKEQMIDRARVGLQGFSRTSWYVEKALEHSPDLYKAALIVDGVDQSYVTDVLFVPGYPKKAIEVEGSIGAPPFGSGLIRWTQNAAGFNLDKVLAPVRLEAHGTTFSVLGEWEIYSILEQQRKAVDFIDIVHGQHILQQPKERYVSQQGAVDWFRFWLQRYERPDPEDKSQYERWKSMIAAPKARTM